MQGTWVQSLVRELRSHMPWGQLSLHAKAKTQHSQIKKRNQPLSLHICICMCMCICMCTCMCICMCMCVYVYVYMYTNVWILSLVAQMITRLLQCGRPRFNPWVQKILWRRQWQPMPELLPGKSRGQRNLVGCSLWG